VGCEAPAEIRENVITDQVEVLLGAKEARLSDRKLVHELVDGGPVFRQDLAEVGERLSSPLAGSRLYLKFVQCSVELLGLPFKEERFEIVNQHLPVG